MDHHQDDNDDDADSVADGKHGDDHDVFRSSHDDVTNSNKESLFLSMSTVGRISQWCKVFSTCMPLWTVLVGIFASRYSSKLVSTVGSMNVMQSAFVVLMVAMGLAAVENHRRPMRDNGHDSFHHDHPMSSSPAVQSSWFMNLYKHQHQYQYQAAVIMNLFLCFGMMPLLSYVIGSAVCHDRSQHVGMVLLGCVSGGQASNLFTLLAGGDVTLSIVLTLTTTLLGVVFTPFWIRLLLRQVVVVDGWDVLQSVARLVLVPVTVGMVLRHCLFFSTTRNRGILLPNKSSRTRVRREESVKEGAIKEVLCPTLGIVATLILVAGGAANSAMLLHSQIHANWNRTHHNGLLYLCWYWWKTAVGPSCLLPVLGGAVSWLMISLIQQQSKQESLPREKTKRTLVVETLSKSPTLAYVLAQKHFGQSAATIPAMSMVTLAVVGAVVASLWSIVDPIERYDLDVDM
jgi:BASS family bile acid:Na+ symporter